MDDQPVVLQIVRVIPSGKYVDLEVTANILPYPPGNFDSPDIVFNGVMAAGLGNQHLIPGVKSIDDRRSPGQLNQISLVSGKKDGEGGAGNSLGGVGHHLEHHLGVTN